MRPEARALCEAHLAHELRKLRGESLGELIDSLIGDVFEWFETVSLRELVEPDQVEGIVARRVIDLEVSPGIKELAGEMARVVLTSNANAEAAVEDIISSESFEDFVSEIFSLGEAWREAVSLVVRSEAFGALVARLVARTTAALVARGASQLSLGPMEAVTQRVQRRVVPALERSLRQAVGERLSKHRADLARGIEEELTAAVDRDFLQAMTDEIWERLARSSMAEAFAVVGEQELEEFVVLVLEFWLRFRESPYFRRVVEEIIAHLYAKYGDGSMASFIEDMGVTQAMFAAEAREVLIPIFAEAARSGLVERQVRAHLEEFYASPAFDAALEAGSS